MITEIAILIKRPSCGYYVRWFYNGFHYWNFLSENESLITEGEKYNTTGKTKVRLYSGQLNDVQIAGLWPLMRAKDVSVYIDGVWKSLHIDPGSLVTYRNQVAGYEFEVNATIGALQAPLIVPEPPVVYVSPPIFVSAEVGLIASNKIVIRFDHVLQIVTPATGDFTPSFSGGAVSVTNVAITDLGGYYYVYLTLSRVIVYGETGTIEYTPGVNKLIGVAPYNAEVYAFTESVVNNVADLVAPVFVSAEIDIDLWPDGDHLTILVDKNLDYDYIPDFVDDFLLTASGGAVSWTVCDIYDRGTGARYIVLTLDRQIAAGETAVGVQYIPGTIKLRGANGVNMLTFNEDIYNRP